MTEQRIILRHQGYDEEPVHLVFEVWKDTGLIVSVPDPRKRVAIIDEVKPIDNVKEHTVHPGVVELGSYYPTLEMSDDREELTVRFRRVRAEQDGDPDGTRTRVVGVKGQPPNH